MTIPIFSPTLASGFRPVRGSGAGIRGYDRVQGSGVRIGCRGFGCRGWG